MLLLGHQQPDVCDKHWRHAFVQLWRMTVNNGTMSIAFDSTLPVLHTVNVRNSSSSTCRSK